MPHTSRPGTASVPLGGVMRRTTAFGTLAATALLLAGGSVLSGPVAGATGTAPASATMPGGGALTVHFDVQFSPFELIDVDNVCKHSNAYEIVFHDTLLRGGHRVGDELGSCVIV